MSQTIIIEQRVSTDLSKDDSKWNTFVGYDGSIAMTEAKRDSGIIPDPSNPLWEIYMDGDYRSGKLLHITGVDDSTRHVMQGKLSLELGEAGSFSFAILPSHALYGDITPYKTTVTIYQEGVEMFRGRVTGYTTNMDRQRQVTCEGDLSYLSDAIFRLTEGGKKTLKEVFQSVIRHYNQSAKLNEMDPRYLAPGDVTISKANYTIDLDEWSTSNGEGWTDARAIIDEFIGIFGGYLRTVRGDDGLVHVEYLSGYTDVNSQAIVYGENLVELTINSKPDDLFTVFIPEGDSNGNGEDSEPTRITSYDYVVDDSVINATIYHQKGSYEMIWEEGVKLYGRIMKTESFSGIDNSRELFQRSMAYFRECIASHLGNFSVKAIDRHYLDPSRYQPIYIGQKVVIKSDLHNVDTENQMLTCVKIDYELDNIDGTAYEFDIPYQPLLNTFSKQTKEKEKKNEKESKKAGGGAKKANDDNEGQDKAIDELDDLVTDLDGRVKAVESALTQDPNKPTPVTVEGETGDITGHSASEWARIKYQREQANKGKKGKDLPDGSAYEESSEPVKYTRERGK